MKRYIKVEPEGALSHKKVKDHPVLGKFIIMMFEYFKINDKTSNIDHISNYNSLLKLILNSKFVNMIYNSKRNIYFISFNANIPLTRRKVFIFLWGNGSQNNNYFIFDLNETDPCVIEINFHCEKYLPFMSQFNQEIDPSKIMSFSELEDFMDINKQDGLTVIKVGG